MTNATKDLVNEIKRLAELNYATSYGWQVWSECKEDAEIAEHLTRENVTTIAGARKLARKWAKIWTDLEQDAAKYAF